jgi:hypothetical protein
LIELSISIEHLFYQAFNFTSFSKAAPLSKSVRFLMVVVAISSNASFVKKPWWEVIKTLENLEIAVLTHPE